MNLKLIAMAHIHGKQVYFWHPDRRLWILMQFAAKQEKDDHNTFHSSKETNGDIDKSKTQTIMSKNILWKLGDYWTKDPPHTLEDRTMVSVLA